MISAQSLAMASRSLWAHKTRSLLTILGVVIGIGAVLTIVTFGASFEASVVNQFDSVDDRTVFVIAGLDVPQQGPPDAGPFGTIFTEVDRDAIALLPGVERVDVNGAVVMSSLETGNRTLPYREALATTPQAQQLRDPLGYESGRSFIMGEREVVIGSTLARLLGDVSAGDVVRLVEPDGTGQNVTVAGVLKPQEGIFADGDATLFVPVDPFYEVRIRSPTSGDLVRVYDGFVVVADDPRRLDDVRDGVRDYITGRSDAAQLLGEDVVIFVNTAGDITDAIGQVFDQVTIFIGGIAVVSLLVGAIGIANIMLVAVAERTREIGVMKAIGALDRQVLALFLTEAILVGVIGSIVGIGLGLAGGAGLVLGLFGDQDVPLTVPYEWVGISVLVGVGVGIVAGFLPARRATKIQPVEALSRE